VFNKHISYVWGISFSVDGKLLASCSQDKSVMIWDTETGHLNHIIEGHFGGVNCVCFSHDWKLVASCSDD